MKVNRFLLVFLVVHLFLMQACAQGGSSTVDDGVRTLSISQFRRMKNDRKEWYRVTGEIVSVSDPATGCLYLYDGESYLYVYGLAPERDGDRKEFPQLGLQPGDEVTIVAHKATYQGVVEASGAYCESRRDGQYPGFTSDCADAAWLELPAASRRDGNVFLCHYSPDGKRNYSVYYNPGKRMALWACYPLVASDRNDGRSNAYAPDPLLDERRQPDLSRSYRDREIDGEEYVRGHLVPSYDREGRRNLDVFLSTNIVPQSKALNSGVWESLEQQTRTWARRCDTLYVVVGTAGVKGEVTDVKGRSVAIPESMYRAVLARTADGKFRALAAVFDNRRSTHESFSRELAISVDELERLCGVDLFCNLPDTVEASVESSDPSGDPFWW